VTTEVHEEIPVAQAIGSERLFDVAPEEELLYSLSADGKRKFMHPIIRRGRFWRIRRGIAYGLMLLFVALPLIPIGGHPAVLLDIATRRFHLFGATFHPTDNLLLAAFGFGTIVTVFFVGSTFGRMWCGYACPQTLYLEFLFRPIEAFLEGGPANQKKLSAAPWSARKLRIRATKWTLWAIVAVLMASVFVSYFTGWSQLLRGLTTAPIAWKGAIFTILFVSVLILFDFGWFRDQMCTITCPYGRLQNVLSDKDTILVAYDEQRGDPKVRLKDRVAGALAGDCIDCRSCVASCPTGTDIRRGLQPECIGVAQCVDACEEVMLRHGKPIGLIKYTSEHEQHGGVRKIWRPRNLIYLALMLVAWSTLGVLLVTRDLALVEIVRGGREPYRLLPTGEVANQQRIRFTNQSGEPQTFTVELVAPTGASFVVSDSPVVVGPEQLVTINAVTTVPHGAFSDGQAEARYRITSDTGYSRDVTFLLLGPFTEAGK
jgi:cytochrome c oxidase accessory protein FixG